MISRTIVYVGPVMSGRSTSLKSVLLRSEQELAQRTVDTRKSYSVRVGSVPVTATIAVARAGRYYTRTPTDGRIQAELDDIVRADGLVFVVDSQRARLPANADERAKLALDLKSRGISIDDVPIVFQANKRDLPTAVLLDELRTLYSTRRSVFVESIAKDGIGTSESIAALLDMF